jgi:hypothetical protein
LSDNETVLANFKTDHQQFDGNIIHLILAKSAPTGGLAYRPEWSGCGDEKGYCFSNITSGGNIVMPNSNDYNWAVSVATHEIGHVLGSHHTHDCVWNNNDTQIDDCGNQHATEDGDNTTSANSCYDPNSKILPDEGTIMSYCHQYPDDLFSDGIGISFALGFGVQPGDRIRHRVNSCPFFDAPTDLAITTTLAPIAFTGTYQDYRLPIGLIAAKAYAIEVKAQGADGGTVDLRGDCDVRGGKGAFLAGTYRLGPGTNEIPYDGTIRFIIGEAGESAFDNDITASFSGGGGGGTGILHHTEGSNFKLLLAAGGGGGGYGGLAAGICTSRAGSSGNASPNGGGSGGSNGGNGGGSNGGGGDAGGSTDILSGGGGGNSADGENIGCGGGGKAGGVTGGAGGVATCANDFSGGYGYGGGGAGKQAGSGGGGGGLSGGAGGAQQQGGGGGGSAWGAGAIASGIFIGGPTFVPDNGYAQYRFLIDNTPPTALCKADFTVDLYNQPISISLSQINNGTFDTESGLYPNGVYIDNDNTINCNDIPTKVFTLTAEDKMGNKATCTTTVTVRDASLPLLICKNHTVQLNQSGQATISSNDVVQEVADNCSFTLTGPTPSAFTCSQIGMQVVTLSVEDLGGNTASCTATVTVADALKPSMLCKPAIIDLDANGQATLTIALVNNGSGDNCTLQSMNLSKTLYACADLGTSTVTLTGTDQSSNTAACTALVLVRDLIPPAPTCVPKYEAQLNASGTVTVTTANILAAAADNCGTVTPVSVSPATFTCANLGGHIVTLTVKDNSNNIATCTGNISVVDVTAPTMFCKNVTVVLNASGQASITPAMVNNGSSDNCAITNLALNRTVFSCMELGPNTVVLTGSDISSNAATCSASVTVVDAQLPVAKCRNITVNLGSNGSVTVPGSNVNNNSTDNCALAFTLAPNTFTCANIGANTVSMTATDVANNKSTCTAILTIKDGTAPTALCKNATIYLNANGQAALSPAQVNNNSTDNCGVTQISVSQTQFSCGELGSGTWPVVLTVKDAANNASTCMAQVKVRDITAPTPICSNTTVQLGSNGLAVVYPAQLAAGSTDNCGVWSYSPTAKVYNNSNIGQNNLTITVRDWSQNASTCVSVVTVTPFNLAPPKSTDDRESIQEDPMATESGLHVALYPNPSAGLVNLAVELPEGQPIALRVVDATGRVVLEQNLEGQGGENVFQLDLSGQHGGIYVVDLVAGKERAQKRVMLLDSRD